MRTWLLLLVLLTGCVDCVRAAPDYYGKRGGGMPPAEARKTRAKMLETLSQHKDGCVESVFLPPGLDIYALAMEEGGGRYPRRSGFEVEMYKRIKDFARHRGPNDQLDHNTLFRMGLETCRDADGNVNVLDVLLTVHNVVKLLARAKNWSGGWETMQDDPVFPILKDLGGLSSVDDRPTMAELMGNLWDTSSKGTPKKLEDLSELRAQMAGLQAKIDREKQVQADLRAAASGWTPGKSRGESPAEIAAKQFELSQYLAASEARIAGHRSAMAKVQTQLNDPTRMIMQPEFIEQYFFASENGVFKPPSGGEEYFGNGGCHYYYWLGAFVRAQLGPTAHGLAIYVEGALKYDEGKLAFNRGLVQLSHYVEGAAFASDLEMMNMMGKLPCANKKKESLLDWFLTAIMEQRDWYCTNRPVIESPAVLPDILKKLDNQADLGELRDWVWKLRDAWKSKGLKTENLEGFLAAVGEQIRTAQTRAELPGFLQTVSSAGERPTDAKGIFAWREQNNKDAYAWYIRALSNPSPARVAETFGNAKAGLSPEAAAKLADGLRDLANIGDKNRFDVVPPAGTGLERPGAGA